MEEASACAIASSSIDHGKVIANDTLHGLHRMLPVTNVLAIELEKPDGFSAEGLLGLRKLCRRKCTKQSSE